jgi:hypothetical protein
MVACLGLAVIPFFTRPFEKVLWQYHAWYEVTVHPLRDRWPGFRDAWTIWDSLWPPVDNRVYMVLQLAAAVAVLGWCLWQRRRDISAGHFLTLIYSMWVSWQLLFGPATEQLTYGIIAPAASWAVLTSFDEKRARWLTLAAWATLALLASGDIEKSVLAILPAGKALLPFGVVLFIGWLTWHERGRDRLA